MPEPIYEEISDGKGNILERKQIGEKSDEQLAREAEDKEIQLVIERLPNSGINKAWKRLIEKGLLP